jgi:hypothetical protein
VDEATFEGDFDEFHEIALSSKAEVGKYECHRRKKIEVQLLSVPGSRSCWKEDDAGQAPIVLV